MMQLLMKENQNQIISLFINNSISRKMYQNSLRLSISDRRAALDHRINKYSRSSIQNQSQGKQFKDNNSYNSLSETLKQTQSQLETQTTFSSNHLQKSINWQCSKSNPCSPSNFDVLISHSMHIAFYNDEVVLQSLAHLFLPLFLRKNQK